MRTITAAGLLAISAGAAMADYPRAGWRAELSTLFHGVSGTMTIVDEDTVRVDHFYYDGAGIDVYFYLGAEQSAMAFADGLPIGEQLVGQPWVDASMVIDLPDGHTLDGYSAVSVWCVDVGVSFGEGTFYCPADFDRSGGLDSQDFIAFLNAFAAGDASADFNRDGTVTSQDFIAFLNEFVAGC